MAAEATIENIKEKMPKAEESKSRFRDFLGGDKHLWGIYIALCLISIVELYSASSREVSAEGVGVYGPLLRHIAQLVGGILIVLFVQKVHYRKFVMAIPVFVILSVLMALYVMFWGENINGARRSFTFIISIQPSEFLKFSSVVFIALVMAMTQNHKDLTMNNRGVTITVIGISLFAILLIRDGLTNTIILMAISLAMMLIGGIRIKKFIIVVAAYAVLGGVFWQFQDYFSSRSELRQERLEQASSEKPKYEQPVTSDNQQEMYSYMAQANGGVTGVFPGNSREASRLPLAFSDFIFSIIIEDLGLVGGIGVLILFLWLLARALGIASRCHSVFPALLVIGMAVMIVTQALTHMAIVTGVAPVSGQPLPLISKGGTSILITSLAFGVMISVSRYGVRSGKKKPVKVEQENLPENIRGNNPGEINLKQ